MAIHKFTKRIIKGVQYLCRDIGCDDFDRAKRNREIISNKLYVVGYIQIEEAVKKTPLGNRLPIWIPLGVVPTVAKTLWTALRGVHKEEQEEIAERVVDDYGG